MPHFLYYKKKQQKVLLFKAYIHENDGEKKSKNKSLNLQEIRESLKKTDKLSKTTIPSSKPLASSTPTSSHISSILTDYRKDPKVKKEIQKRRLEELQQQVEKSDSDSDKSEEEEEEDEEENEKVKEKIKLARQGIAEEEAESDVDLHQLGDDEGGESDDAGGSSVASEFE